MAEAPTGVAQQTGSDKAGIRPFQISFPEAALTDLRKRINATKWPEPETVTDATQGVQFATMQKLARYWGNEYDWSKCEARAERRARTSSPRSTGSTSTFIHVRSKHENALPVIITHGWPGLVHRADEDHRAAHQSHRARRDRRGRVPCGDSVAAGLRLSRASRRRTTGIRRTSRRAWAVLMKRLGYTKYVAQGGDWGNAVSRPWHFRQPPGLLGIATNMPATVPAEISKAHGDRQSAAIEPLGGRTESLGPAGSSSTQKGLAYANEMGLRPQTLYGIADSPVGLAAWILDHDAASYELIVRVFDGKPEGLTRDDILDNITHVLADEHGHIVGGACTGPRNRGSKGAAASSTREAFSSRGRERVSGRDLRAPKSWAERAYPKLLLLRQARQGRTLRGVGAAHGTRG